MVAYSHIEHVLQNKYMYRKFMLNDTHTHTHDFITELMFVSIIKCINRNKRLTLIKNNELATSINGFFSTEYSVSFTSDIVVIVSGTNTRLLQGCSI